MATNPSPRTGGRIRNDEAHEAVLDATTDLLESGGYGALTIEGVARRSGVAKSTIYRWWKTKGDLVMEAYTRTTAHRVPSPDTGTLTGDLTALLRDLYAIAHHPARAKALRGLMAEAQLDPAFAEPFRAWIETRREVLAEVYGRAAARGELAEDLDLAHATDLVYGPFWYRLLVGHAPLDPADAPAHAARIRTALAARGA
ncbi:TetR/AcrR family transcriptional regulator [Streptomyces sp. NPDC089915]|uniref:TetR/AcrR family transcriptional regulator n=1 Tax=Streptomyces sp. NPDC089915 TaxID=3155186 RepID=UPI0034423D4A